MTQGEMEWCKNCKYKEYYKKFSEIADYVEKEADRRIKEMKDRGELKPKTEEPKFKTHKDFIEWLMKEAEKELGKDWMDKVKE